ncbi:DNA gyrase inhibitor YacG [Rhabdaerophilum sp. SD176]|jgi:hypothetical protein|uniref:DNA gyrase inhibitor YacG n=1 Tax=Rhabdaerophilum sp. SD176 TaxID=2983548 RepID=UPI0024DF806E|nr:DNA gyrase inhibitor YacG [Rhabdaerophilum sp. SD176]
MAEAKDPTLIRAPRCPICERLTIQQFRPFCSKRCADVDLSRWLNGIYAVPERDEDEGDGHRSDEPYSS